MVLGLALGTAGVFWPQIIPVVCLEAMHRVLKGALAMIATMSGWRWAAIPLPAPSLTVCAVYYFALICILIKLRHDKNKTQSRGRL